MTKIIVSTLFIFSVFYGLNFIASGGCAVPSPFGHQDEESMKQRIIKITFKNNAEKGQSFSEFNNKNTIHTKL